MADLSTRISAILEIPWEALEYERWIAQHKESSDDYLFADSRARFEADSEDRPRVPGDLTAVDGTNGVELRSAQLGGGVAVRGVKRALAQRLLGWIDGERTLAEIRVLAGADRPALERLLAAALGSAVFLPQAVAALERRISGTELVRFVGVPYELVRNYWSNMASVRERAAIELPQCSDVSAFGALLRRLHVIALLGEDLRSFYRPASRIALGGVQPGSFHSAPLRVLRTAGGPLLLEGPRVGVTLTGGVRYHAALYAAAGDAEALDDRAQHVDGLPIGEVLTGRSVEDRESAAWFCPPRPVLPAHLEHIFAPLQAALRGENDANALAALAQFHWRFVRIHPFRCANQSLSMNLVNLVLARRGGAGIPHLLLDQLALRLTEAAYARVFALAVATHTIQESAEQRWTALRQRKALAYGLIQRLSAAKSDADAAAIVRDDPHGARAALIVPH